MHKGRPPRVSSDADPRCQQDSLRLPFFKAEEYHQFHANTVLGRPVPAAYTGELKAAQAAAGRLALRGCADDSAAGQLAGLIPLAIGIAAVIGLFNCVEAAGKLRGGGEQKGGRGVGASIQGSSYS